MHERSGASAPGKGSTLAEQELRTALFEAMGIPGVVARTRLYEEVVDALSAMISGRRPPEAEVLRFPPVMSRSQIEKSGYLGSFPNLLGCVCGLHGETAESGTATVHATDIVLTPAACYPVYPMAAARGQVPEEGYVFDVAADVFRHEPSENIDRFQSFRMREYVRIGSGPQALEFRDRWLTEAQAMALEQLPGHAEAQHAAADAVADGSFLQAGARCDHDVNTILSFKQALQLPFAIDRANDPFFGRVGRFRALRQVQEALKFELLVPIRPGAPHTACMSFNYHREHFGQTWNLRQRSGDPAHSACAAFGLDRLAVALFSIHGLVRDKWPATVLAALALSRGERTGA
jgi:hypothetical protein